MDKKNHMKNYAKAIFSERNALTDVTIGFTWANAPLEALARGAYSEGSVEQPAGVHAKSAEERGVRATHIPFQSSPILANLPLLGSVNLQKKKNKFLLFSFYESNFIKLNAYAD